MRLSSPRSRGSKARASASGPSPGFRPRRRSGAEVAEQLGDARRSDLARNESLRAAGRRYQHSRRGRHCHAERRRRDGGCRETPRWTSDTGLTAASPPRGETGTAADGVQKRTASRSISWLPASPVPLVCRVPSSPSTASGPTCQRAPVRTVRLPASPSVSPAYLRHVFTELPKAQSLADIEALLPTRLDPAALARDSLQELFPAARQ